MRIVSLIALALFLFPSFALAALVNINTADATLLDTLPGIGPSKANAIVDYRNINGLFANIEDIQNVSGIGPSTFANISSLITVGVTESGSTATTTSVETVSSGAGPVYVPPPSSIVIEIDADFNATANVPLKLSAIVTTKGGARDYLARVIWGFGDGSSTEGTVIDKIYRNDGTYLVTATASVGPAIARDEIIITVTHAKVSVSDVSATGITVSNDSNRRIDLSDWWIYSGGVSFRVPQGTILLPLSKVLFPYTITHLFMTQNVFLNYPDNALAVKYEKPAITVTTEEILQPSINSSSSPSVQRVESAFSKTISMPVREAEQIIAPSAPPLAAALGAALPDPTETQTTAPTRSSIRAVLKSPWTLGFIGLVILSAGAFIFL